MQEEQREIFTQGRVHDQSSHSRQRVAQENFSSSLPLFDESTTGSLQHDSSARFIFSRLLIYVFF